MRFYNRCTIRRNLLRQYCVFTPPKTFAHTRWALRTPMTNVSNPQCRRLNESLFVSKALPLRCHRLVTEPARRHTRPRPGERNTRNTMNPTKTSPCKREYTRPHGSHFELSARCAHVQKESPRKISPRRHWLTERTASTHTHSTRTPPLYSADPARRLSPSTSAASGGS